MILDFLRWFSWDTIFLGCALFFTFTGIECMVRDATMGDDTMADHILVEKVGACICWALFYYFTH